MAAQTVTSDKAESKVGTAGTKIYTSTRTTFSKNSDGTIDPKSVKHEILYHDAPLSPGIVAATSTGTSGNWSFNNKPLSNTPVLGPDAQKSLKEGVLKATTENQITTAATKAGIPAKDQKALSTKQVNTAATAENTGDQQITTDLAKENKQTRNSFFGAGGSQVLKYPLNLQNEYQDIIKFKMVKYAPKPISTGGDLNPVGSRPTTREIIGQVVLPIPAGISIANMVEWGQDTFNPLQATAATIALSGITGGGKAAADQTNNAVDAASANSSDLKAAVANYFTEQATGTTNLLSRTKGAISNPNMELLFNAPSLRPFSFSFKLSARSKDESERIRSIIRFFKQGMSPIRTESQLFLKAPHTFQVEYLHKGESHRYLNKFKECALQSCTIDYTPEGNYATFSDGAMVSYMMTLQFTELEPIFNDDHGNSTNTYPDPDIGY
jgi:hypothetical protein